MELNPNSIHVYADLVETLDEFHNWHEVLTKRGSFLFQKLNPSSHTKIYSCLGVAFAKQKKWDRAVFCYKKALEGNPNSAKIYHHLGYAFEKLQKRYEAVKSYRQALQLKPESKEIRDRLDTLTQ
ncbi:tetratricopeptide repeat protein [Okeania sp. KiyG1]|uniref:tetratricopeptide repeat protein n=1 Tax=Okeania sp. KiyG1 TaxID=2720165 RepID=UPI0021053D35|nr:tetratricopeptide repeat protein [Okeania sp. KiyG1]